jgi:hypothetical protein
MADTPPHVLAYYAVGGELGRLLAGAGILERLRTEELLGRVLEPGSRVLDVAAARASTPNGSPARAMRCTSSIRCRFAPPLDGVRNGWLADERRFANVEAELADGKRVSPEGRGTDFPEAYFYLPEELAAEAVDAGLRDVDILGVEDPACGERSPLLVATAR